MTRVQEHVDPAGGGGAAAAGLDRGQGEVPVRQPRDAGHQGRPHQDREMLSLFSQHDTEISTLHNTAQCPLTYHRLININSNSSAGLGWCQQRVLGLRQGEVKGGISSASAPHTVL